MSIYLTGDTHAYCQNRLSFSNWPISKTLTKNDYLIILGDFGYIWDIQLSAKETRNLQWLSDKPWTTLVLDGNHENFDRILSDEFPEVDMFGSKVKKLANDVYYLQRGHVYNIDNNKIFVMGGASSTDKVWRTPYISWWPQELPSVADYNIAMNNLDSVNNEVDYILSHTAPERILKEFLDNTGHCVFGSDVLMDSLIDFFNIIESNIKFKKWYFGHMHPNSTWSSTDNKFYCLYNDIKCIGD